MGLLDQAIREHLELKRQHGADPGELARLEREALGPPVRETQEVLATAAGPAAPSPGVPETMPVEPEGRADESPGQPAPQATAPFDAEQAMADEPVDGAGTIADGPPSADKPAHPAAASPTESSAPPSDPAAPDPEPSPAPDDPTAPAAEPTAPAPAERSADEPTGSPAVEESPPEREADEDVLEETPEFLQETPEHDRLWFEQRPPRDFDFDG
jgi:hypothetical protein